MDDLRETKIIYYIDEEETPYLVKVPMPPDKVTLRDFKNALNRPNYKFFFKSMDADFGVVKEEIIDEDAILPSINGRVVSWLVAADGSDAQSHNGESDVKGMGMTKNSTLSSGLSAVPPHFLRADHFDSETTETESMISSKRDYAPPPPRPHHSAAALRPRNPKASRYRDQLHTIDETGHGRANGHAVAKPNRGYESSSMMSSELESTSFFDSEDDRYSTLTDSTSVSSRFHGRYRKKRRRHRVPPAIDRASSFSSLTDSTMSLNIITVTLSMDTVNFLGISIVGQSNKGGDGGIYVGSIMKGGAVAADGRIEPGDMILQVNDISFENMSNDDAVRVLREAVQKPGPIKLVVAKCWDPNPKGYFTVPRQEPVRPIDPSAWVAHTQALTNPLASTSAPSISAMSSATSSVTTTASSIPESERYTDDLNLTVNTDMAAVVRAMAAPDSGLDIRDRMWLKITIPKAFIGSDVVDWLFTHVEGFADRRDARKYGCNLLKCGYIRHTVNKLTFSEQCYYIFGDLAQTFSTMNLHDHDLDSVSETDRDTLGPLPPPPLGHAVPYGFIYPPSMPDVDNFRGGHSGGSSSSTASNGSRKLVLPMKPLDTHGSGSSSGCGSATENSDELNSESGSVRGPLLQQQVPPDVAGSRQSFRMAMGNPCEFFVDVM